MKKNIVVVDPQEILKKVATLPVSHWTYKKEADGIRHLGPMAQDFHAAFGLGTSDKNIGTLDTSGVALAAIQGLHQQLQNKDKQIDELTGLVAKLSDRLDQLESHVQTSAVSDVLVSYPAK